jgi:hypothetical protein
MDREPGNLLSSDDNSGNTSARRCKGHHRERGVASVPLPQARNVANASVHARTAIHAAIRSSAAVRGSAARSRIGCVAASVGVQTRRAARAAVGLCCLGRAAQGPRTHHQAPARDHLTEAVVAVATARRGAGWVNASLSPAIGICNPTTAVTAVIRAVVIRIAFPPRRHTGSQVTVWIAACFAGGFPTPRICATLAATIRIGFATAAIAAIACSFARSAGPAGVGHRKTGISVHR